MERVLESLNISNFVAESENNTRQEGFAKIIMNRGIDSAVITYKNFAFGQPVSEGKDFRKFFYDKEGRVVRKLSFDTDGNIVIKEESTFDNKGKIIANKIITPVDISDESYEYTEVKGRMRLSKYTFDNHKWLHPKIEEYHDDRFGRIAKKVSFGHLGCPELITRYIYDTDKDRKVTYRHVTLPDETLVLTLLYTYDNKKEKQTALYSFLLSPDEITELRQTDKDTWELESLSQSHWKYDAAGNISDFYRDEDFVVPLNWFGVIDTNSFKPGHRRIVTERSESEYTKINEKYYLAKTTEFLTRFEEPYLVKEYTYWDKGGKAIP
jgi:hypothetical protein